MSKHESCFVCEKKKEKMERWYEMYFDAMAKEAGQILSNENDIFDVIHETFTILLETENPIDTMEEENIKESLLLAVHLLAVDVCQKQDIEKERHQRFGYQWMNHSLEITKDFERKEDEHMLFYNMKKLPKSLSQILFLYYLNDFSIRQITIFLGISSQNARQRLSRARRRLQQLMIGEKEKEVS